MQHTLSDYHLSQITLKPLTLVLEDVVSQTSSYCQAEKSQSFPPVTVAHPLPLPCLEDPLSVTSSYFNSRKPPNMENGMYPDPLESSIPTETLAMQAGGESCAEGREELGGETLSQQR